MNDTKRRRKRRHASRQDADVASHPAASRTEYVLFGLLLIAGALLRCASPSHLAVEHFDEGVYASNIFFGPEARHRYPERHLYAPPLLPGLVEAASILFGTNPPVPMFVNLLAGTLTIAAVWWVGRVCFGPLAGMLAAALCAVSEFHILYSRSVLTDPLLCLWLVMAVGCLIRAHRQQDVRWMMAGGVLTGLAWWTKYNGWLPLAVQISGIAAWLLFSSRAVQKSWAKHVGLWLGTAACAVLLWSPVWFGLQDLGGYAPVAENHRGYLVGFSGWPASFYRQLQAHWHVESFASIAGVALAVLCVTGLVVHGRFETSDKRHSRTALWWTGGALAVLLAGLAAAAGTSVLLGVLAVAGIALHLLWPNTAWFNSTAPGESTRGEGMNGTAGTDAVRLGAWLLAAWFVGLLLATPLYRAYPRLSLPWLVSAWLGAGACVEWFVRRGSAIRENAAGLLNDGAPSERRNDSPDTAKPRRRLRIAGAFVVGLVLLVVFRDNLSATRFPAWQDRRGFRRIAPQIVHRAERQTSGERRASGEPSSRQQPPIVIYVYGEPGLFYHLAVLRRRGGGSFLVQPVADLNVTPARYEGNKLPTFLVTGPHAHRSAAVAEQLDEAVLQLEPVGEAFPYRASDFILLNEYSAAEIQQPGRRPMLQVQLWRVRR